MQTSQKKHNIQTVACGRSTEVEEEEEKAIVNGDEAWIQATPTQAPVQLLLIM